MSAWPDAESIWNPVTPTVVAPPKTAFENAVHMSVASAVAEVRLVLTTRVDPLVSAPVISDAHGGIVAADPGCCDRDCSIAVMAAAADGETPLGIGKLPTAAALAEAPLLVELLAAADGEAAALDAAEGDAAAGAWLAGSGVAVEPQAATRRAATAAMNRMRMKTSTGGVDPALGSERGTHRGGVVALHLTVEGPRPASGHHATGAEDRGPAARSAAGKAGCRTASTRKRSLSVRCQSLRKHPTRPDPRVLSAGSAPSITRPARCAHPCRVRSPPARRSATPARSLARRLDRPSMTATRQGPRVATEVAATIERPWPGQPYPLGATYDGLGTNFALFSEVAEHVDLCLFDPDGLETRVPLEDITGFVWHGYLPAVAPG